MSRLQQISEHEVATILEWDRDFCRSGQLPLRSKIFEATVANLRPKPFPGPSLVLERVQQKARLGIFQEQKASSQEPWAWCVRALLQQRFQQESLFKSDPRIRQLTTSIQSCEKRQRQLQAPQTMATQRQSNSQEEATHQEWPGLPLRQ